MIGPQGFFVFESKNYSGWIFGDDRNEIWCQTLPHYSGGSFKTRFYNPVKQNFNHICALKNLCHSDIPCYSIVVFSDRCEIKKLTLSHPRSFVIHHYELTDCIENIVQLNSQYLTPSQIDHFYNTLYICTQVSASLKEAHIHNIRFYHRVHKEPISAEEPICPICGGKLIVRISKRGKYMNKPFLGCSNYPKCKYIKPLKKLN